MHTEKDHLDLTDRKERKRRRAMTLFIQAAEELLRQEGPAGVTIRRVAGATGYSSAALYSYFADVEELVLYASLQYRAAHLAEAARTIAPEGPALPRYRRYCELFNRHALRAPAVYLNLYFGRCSGRLPAAEDIYRQLFPQRAPALSAPESLPALHREAARRLCEEGVLRRENADAAAALITRTQEALLYEMSLRPDGDPEAQGAAFLALFDRIIGVF